MSPNGFLGYRLISLSIGLETITAFGAFDANTIAFYPFKEGAAGTSLNGVTVVNDMGEAYAGTLYLGNSANDTVVYDADS